MDLFAYCQIADLEYIAQTNGIEVPRLRGYRLMSEEQFLTREDITEAAHGIEMHIYESACCSIPRFRPDSGASEFSRRTRAIEKKYLVKETVVDTRGDGSEYSREKVVGFRWNLLHGKNRKAVKFAIKKRRKMVVEQLQTFNKYVGRNDVLYIHARIGGSNWGYYGGNEIAKQPWFLEKVDDYFDEDDEFYDDGDDDFEGNEE